MEIKDLFKKDITRNIEGVVMIGNEDEQKKFQELDEYVCTEEITKNFRKFFSAYRKALDAPTEDMGVWITGFFGSGKSHFLKILGYVLSNEEVRGKKAVDYFNDKIADPMLLGDMRRSANANNLVILFNIDSKAKSDAKNRNTSIMETMLNSFNAKLGYCESITWLAEMERGLDKEGLYQKFIQHFNEISGKDYLSQRKNIFFLRDKFIQALSDVKGISQESARDFFDDSQKHFSLNTEDFSKIVVDYCEKTGKHVIFLMDEVGQFIGSNSEMMLGLQTVVEDLGKQAHGKAWVVVTSQQQIDALIEGTNKAAQMDFSKITGRFATRLTMSSQNADEVIQKRLLEKTPDAANTLGALYENQKDKLNNLLVFPANPKWTGYSSKEEFIKDYPFVNYQFELLQQVFDAIRENGMSEGKSISSGERSLLSAFKDSAVAKCHEGIGVLIPFNDFYRTADEFMDWNVKQIFARAKKRMPDDFDNEVLKVLFMLKNVKEMEPTIERIATLMVSSIDEDKVVLKKRIKDSLDRLVAETFVQQNGDRYEFLTDEEQEANRKIKNSSYSQGDVYNKIRDIVYENILETGKSFSYSKYSFPLNRYIDENLTGSENPEGINVKIYTPWDNAEMSFEQRSLASDGCLIIDLTKGTYLDELIQCARIDTFQRNNSAMASASMMTILQKKNAEHMEREKRAENLIKDCLKDADYYQNGSKLDLSSSEPKKRFALAMEKAILNKFHALNYVVDFATKTDDIVQALRNSQAGELFDRVENDANSKALIEILRFVSEERKWNRSTSLRGLIDHFRKAPYGYRDIDIRLMVAKLLNWGRLKAKVHEVVQNTATQDFVWKFTHSNDDQYISIEEQRSVDPSKISKARMVMKNAFDVSYELKEKKLCDDSLAFSYDMNQEDSLTPMGLPLGVVGGLKSICHPAGGCFS